MSKEITLSELLANNHGTTATLTPEKVATKEARVPESTSNKITQARTVPAPGFNGGVEPSIKKVSIDEVASALPGRPKEEIKNPEIVDNALKSMHETLNRKKAFFEEEVIPVMEQNAKEMAMEKEMESMGVGSEPSSIAKEDAIDRVTDSLDEDMIEEEIANMDQEEEQATYAMPEMPDLQKPQVPKEKEEAPVQKKEQPRHVQQKANLLEEEETLDDLLKDLDTPSVEEDIDDDWEDEESIEEKRKRLKSSISKVIQPSTIDFSEYSVRVKPLAVSAVLNNINSHKVVKTADWALFGSKRAITVTEVLGPELDALAKSIRVSNSINAAIMSLKLVYNHVVDANKPPFEIWARSIHTEDLDSLYFALYRATYADTNMIAYVCQKPDDNKYGCKKTSVLDTNIDKMVKFESPEVEEQFNDLLLKDTTTADIIERPSLMALSNDIAITYNMPNLYSTLIQYSTLNPKIVDKYDELLNTLAYIDGFFYIDHSSKELVPMPTKQYPNNLNKTVLEKLKLYGQVLKTLSSDEYDIALTKLSNLGDSSKIEYVIPEAVCPECGATIPEEPIDSVLNMVFNRRQLAQIQGL